MGSTAVGSVQWATSPFLDTSVSPPILRLLPLSHLTIEDTTDPRGAVGGGKESSDLGFRKEADQRAVETLLGNAEHALNERGVLGMAKGGEAEKMCESLGYIRFGEVPKYARSGDGRLEASAFFYCALD